MKVRKKIYTTDLYNLSSFFSDYFSQNKETPLPLVKINGVRIKKNTRHFPTHMFPNPETSTMLFDFFYSTKAHTKMSTVVVEYMNTKNEPILYLFPNGSTRTVSDDKLNSKMKRDLAYQIELRKNMIAKAKQK